MKYTLKIFLVIACSFYAVSIWAITGSLTVNLPVEEFSSYNITITITDTENTTPIWGEVKHNQPAQIQGNRNIVQISIENNTMVPEIGEKSISSFLKEEAVANPNAELSITISAVSIDSNSNYSTEITQTIGAVPYAIVSETIDMNASINNAFIMNNRINIGDNYDR